MWGAAWQKKLFQLQYFEGGFNFAKERAGVASQGQPGEALTEDP